MSNFFSLLKVSFIQQFNLNKIFKKDRLLLNVLMGILIVFCLLFLGFSMYFTYYAFLIESTNLKEDMKSVIAFAIFLTSLIQIIVTITRANQYIFKSKDFDLIGSLPISFKTIIFARLSSFLILTYLYSSVIYFPMILLALITNTQSISFYLISLLVFVLLPLFIVAIFSGISYLFSYLTRNFKFKNLISIIVSILFLILIFMLSFTQGDQTTNPLIGLTGILKYLYYPGYLSVIGLTGNYVALLLFILLSVIPFIIFVVILSKNFVKVNTAMLKTNSKNKKIKLNNKVNNNIIKELSKKEFKQYFSSPTYVINTMAGKIMFLIMMIMPFSNISSDLDFIAKEGIILFVVVMTLVVSMTSTTSSSISLEGKKLWILQSLPIKPKEVFISKLSVEYFITVIILLIGLTIFSVILNVTLINIILAIVIIFIFAAHSALLGLICNLHFPKLVWDQEVKVIKQSLSVLINMILSFVFGAIIIALTTAIVLVFSIQSSAVMLIIYIVFLTMVVVLETLYLFKIGEKRYLKL